MTDATSSTSVKTKVCSLCHERKPLAAFHRRQHYVRSGHRAACKDCTREAARKARVEKPQRSDRLKHRVRMRTRSAIRRGDLTARPCRICGHHEAEAHHPDYEAPDAHLRVDWLCRKHHALEHGIRPWTNQLELFPVLVS
jgi:hypothetical protein